jgi:hypothetical protein
VPARLAPAFGATENVAAPDPVFAAADSRAMKLLLLVALHVHPAAVETETVVFSPAAGMVTVVADTVYAQACRWFTVSVWLPIVTLPERGTPGFAAMLTFTVPGPVMEPAETVMNATLLVAVHVQAGAAVTASVAMVAVSSTVSVDCDSAVEHGGGACVIVTVCPATVSVPVRALPPAFADTVTETLPVPLPPPGATVRKLALLCAVHVQLACAATGTVSVPPAASMARVT